MRRLDVLAIAIAAAALCAAPAIAQSTFSVSFAFESGGKKLPAGNYVVTKTGEAQVTFHHVSSGKEWVLPVAEKLKPADAPSADPHLVFDEVGNFEPSYTEYFTVYVLAEVWFSGQDGYLIHVTKGAHKDRVVKGESVRKEKRE